MASFSLQRTRVQRIYYVNMTVRVDLFVDIVCPWCFIGCERLTQAADGMDIAVVHHPFLLDPRTPAAGVNVGDMLRQKYGRDPRSMWAVVEGEARASGLALDLSVQPLTFPTVRAHTVLRHAASRGTQWALTRALFRSYFVEARNINDADVLADVAVDHGFTRAETLALVTDDGECDHTQQEALAAARSGIRGVPFFILNESVALSGAQPVSVLRDALRQVGDGAVHP